MLAELQRLRRPGNAVPASYVQLNDPQMGTGAVDQRQYQSASYFSFKPLYDNHKRRRQPNVSIQSQDGSAMARVEPPAVPERAGAAAKS